MPQTIVTNQVGGLPAGDAGEPTFRSMVEFAPAYFYQASTDVAETLYLSPPAEIMLGYGEAEWKADPLLWINALHPEDRDRVLRFVGVSATSDANWATVSVSDSGIGIAEADQERIFDEFVRVGAGHPNAQVGTGLGLPLARHLVHARGGTIAATSTPGVESTFTVRLQRV